MEVMMSRLFKVCFALAVFVVFYFVGYAGAGIIHSSLAQPEPVSQDSLELLANWHSQQFPDATPWETCEQEVN
jgi:hypothetical protein